MKNSESVGEEIVTILILVLTLAIASSNLASELLKQKTWTENLPLIEVIN